jgi:prepilin peptidase CpaA
MKSWELNSPDLIKMLNSLFAYALPVLVIMAAVLDVHSYRIPNWLNGLTALVFLPVALWAGMAWSDIGMHYLAGVLLLLTGYLFFTLGIFGGGDAKLIAACGVWFGTQDAGLFLHAAVMCGGVLAIVMLGWTLAKYIIQLDFGDFLPSIRKVMPQMPYGVALAAGAIIAFPESAWLTKLMQMS